MAYLRYGPDSDWYVFWYSDKAEAEEEDRTGRKVPKAEIRLAVWHSDHRAQIPGFEPSHLMLLRSALDEFVRDVDEEYRT